MTRTDVQARRPLPKLRAADVAYDTLESMIVTLQLKPGAPIVEAELVDSTGLGRTPLREALMRMSSNGLIVQLPRRGLIVSDIEAAEHLTLIEQITEDIAHIKTRRASCRDPRIRHFWNEEIARFKCRLRTELKELVVAIRQHPDLAARLDLINSVDGVGLRTAVAILVRMPEIGRITREHAAALAGLAAYDDDSGEHVGVRHIAGGRERLRKSLYTAALAAAFHWNPQLIAIYRRLIAAGKPHKVALIACARKLLIFVNTVVARGAPWTERPGLI